MYGVKMRHDVAVVLALCCVIVTRGIVSHPEQTQNGTDVVAFIPTIGLHSQPNLATTQNSPLP